MPRRAIAKVLCFLVGLIMLTVWLLSDSIFAPEPRAIRVIRYSVALTTEACGSALWRLRCMRDDDVLRPQASARNEKTIRATSLKPLRG